MGLWTLDVVSLLFVLYFHSFFCGGVIGLVTFSMEFFIKSNYINVCEYVVLLCLIKKIKN